MMRMTTMSTLVNRTEAPKRTASCCTVVLGIAGCIAVLSAGALLLRELYIRAGPIDVIVTNKADEQIASISVSLQGTTKLIRFIRDFRETRLGS